MFSTAPTFQAPMGALKRFAERNMDSMVLTLEVSQPLMSHWKASHL